MNTTKQLLPGKKINVTLSKSSQEIIAGNILNIPIIINKTQNGVENLYVGKKLKLFYQNSFIVGTYQQKLNANYQQKADSTDYIRLDNISDLNNTTFNVNSVFQYYEIDNILNDSVPITINDVKRLLVTTKNNQSYKGTTGLLEPLHLEAIESLKFLREINQKTFGEILSYSTVVYYETLNTDKDALFNFGMMHSLFNVEFELKIVGNSYTIRTKRFGTTESLNNFQISIIVNKLISNDSVKALYQVNVRLNNVPSVVQTNVEKIRCYVNENINSQNVFVNLPLIYNLSNLTQFIPERVFTRFILFYDKNGVVSLNPNESIKLNGTQNLNNVIDYGWYHYDVFNSGDTILTNLPESNKNLFYLNVKRLSDNLTVQNLYVADATGTILKIFSRIRNNSTLVFSDWIEYVNNKHKHLAEDITTNERLLFVSQDEKDEWNSYSASISAYWNNAVATTNDFPATGLNGEARLCLADMRIYVYVAIENKWRALNDPKIYLEVTSDNVKLKINSGGLNREVSIPLVTDQTPGLLPADVNATNYKDTFESKLNFTVTTVGSEVPGYYQKQLGYSFNLIKTPQDKIKDGIVNHLITKNNESSTLDLSDPQSKISKTLYSKYDTSNIFSEIVTEFNFILKTPKFGNNKILFGSNKNIVYYDATFTETTIPLSNNEFILAHDTEYHMAINGNNITIITL